MLPSIAASVLSLLFFSQQEAAPADLNASPSAVASQRRRVVAMEARKVAQQLEGRGLSLPSGFYIAFDPDVRLAYGTAACDDDGDYVVVVSDALLLTASYAALGEEEASSFATALTRTPRASRLPVPGSVPKAHDDAASSAYYINTVHTLLVREMTPLATKDGRGIPARYRCPSPTETHEAADSVWTVDEQRAATMHGDRVHREPEVAPLPSLPERFRTLLERCSRTSYLSSFAGWNVRLP